MLEVTAAIICKDGEVLICQRPKGKNCELLWEFPGGKIESGETAEACIVREIQEELGVTLRVLRKFTDVICEYPEQTTRPLSAEQSLAESCLEQPAPSLEAPTAPVRRPHDTTLVFLTLS